MKTTNNVMANQVSANEIAQEIAMEYYAGLPIYSRRQTENLRAILNGKGKSISITNLIIEKNGVVEISILKAPCNLETKHLKIGRELVMTSNASARAIKDFTYDVLNIDINDPDFVDMVSADLLRVGKGFDEKFFVNSDKPGKVYNLISRELEDDSIVFDENGKVKPGVRTYSGSKGGQVSSASQLRKFNITMACNSDVQAMLDRLDIVTYGAFDLINGTLTTKSGLVKYSARIGQFKAPSCLHDFNVDTFAVLMRKIKNRVGNQYSDGAAKATSSFVARAFSTIAEGKYSFKERSTHGLVIQCRPWTTKVMAQVVEQAYLDELISSNGYEIVFINRNEITPGIQAAFDAAFAGDQTSPFYGKLVVIGEDANAPIDFFTDLNGLKATFKLERTSGFNVLDIGNTQPNLSRGAATSMQMLQTLLFCNYDEAMAYIEKVGSRQIQEAFDALVTKEATVPSIDEFDNLYATNSIVKFARKFTLENNAKLFRSQADNFMKGMSGRIKQLKLDIAGTTAKIVPDFAMDFEQMVLGITDDGMVEVYCPAAERYFTDLKLDESEWIITGYKYPKMHVQEFLLARVVSSKEIARRIGELKISGKQINLLRRQFKGLSESVIVVPAIELLKNMLAGMDFDADAMTVVFDQEFNSIIVRSGVKPIAVVLDDAGSVVDKTPVRVTPDIAWKVLSQFAKNKNKSIGEITIMNDLLIALLIMVRRGLIKEAQIVMALSFKGEHVIAKYVSPLKVVPGEFGIPKLSMTEALMDTIVDNIADMALTKENMEAALLDLIAVGRMQQERTIDSAKTNDKVKAPYDINAVANAKSRSEIKLAIKWQDDSVTVVSEEDAYAKFMEEAGVYFQIDKAESGYVGEGKKKRYSVLNDFHVVRILLARKLFVAAYKLKAVKHAFSEEQLAVHKQVVARKEVSEIRAFIVEAKMIYDDLTGIMRKEIKGKNDELKRAIKEDYNNNIEALSNHVRRLTDHMDAVDRAILLTVVGRESNFAFTVCQQEYVHMTVVKHAEIDFAGEKLDKCDFEVGEMVEFIGGLANVAGKLAVTKSSITGTFEIREYNDKLYAAKNIIDLVSIPEINTKQVVIKTKALIAGQAREVSSKIMSGTTIQLKAYNGDEVVVDGVAVCGYVCGDRKGGKLTQMYKNAKGVVEHAVAGRTRGNDGKQYNIMIIVLNDAIIEEPTQAEIIAEDTANAIAKVTAKRSEYGNGINFLSGSNTSI